MVCCVDERYLECQLSSSETSEFLSNSQAIPRLVSLVMSPHDPAHLFSLDELPVDWHRSWKVQGSRAEDETTSKPNSRLFHRRLFGDHFLSHVAPCHSRHKKVFIDFLLLTL